ncbi:MAG: PHP domain-containing protein [bacterium]
MSILLDIHNHTTFSDGLLTPFELKALADKMGMVIGISDHLEYGNLDTVDRFSEYLNVLGKLGVHKGVELGMIGDVPISYELLDKLDYIIGGLHRFEIDGQKIEIFEKVEYSGSVDLFMDEMVRSLVACAKEYPIDILAHPTYVPQVILYQSNVQSLWTDDRMVSIIETCVENCVSIEISNKWKVPHERFIRIALDMGAIFSIGSDGHNEKWYLNLEYPSYIIDRFDIPEGRIFTPDKSIKRLRRFV